VVGGEPGPGGGVVFYFELGYGSASEVEVGDFAWGGAMGDLVELAFRAVGGGGVDGDGLGALSLGRGDGAHHGGPGAGVATLEAVGEDGGAGALTPSIPLSQPAHTALAGEGEAGKEIAAGGGSPLPEGWRGWAGRDAM
jgi:hypothetical protein